MRFWLAVTAVALPTGMGQIRGGTGSARGSEGPVRELNATDVQTLCVRISDAVAFAQSAQQLRGVLRVLPSPEFGPAVTELTSRLEDVARDLRLLFGGESDLPRALAALERWPLDHAEALSRTPTWTASCPAAQEGYATYRRLRAEHADAEAKRLELARQVASWRTEHARVSGNASANPQDGVAWRLLDTQLVTWNVLRTKVAHELAYTASEGHADEEATAAAEAALAELSRELEGTLQGQKARAKEMRKLLKRLLARCEENDAWRQNRRVEEEYVHFFASASAKVQDLVSLARDLLAPVLGPHRARLPQEWVGKKPRWASWWQWVDKPRTPQGLPLSFAEFEAEFKRADQEFSSKITSRDPLLLAMLWASVLEEANPPEVLAIGR